MAQGPLQGVRVLELAGLGPAPFCAMLLSDLGADVVRIDRPQVRPPAFDLLARGRTLLSLDLKRPEDVEAALALAEQADVLIEGFRPGVMERLGLGPEVVLARQPRLVYARMTGWGQAGPLAQAAGHDLNYLALSGALHAMGRPDSPPPPPLNLAADFGGGALYLAMGICAALVERTRSGRGQVIDAAMTDGAASLATLFYGLRHAGIWQDARGANLLDGGAPFYDCYECGCGGFVAVGALEPQFYALLLSKLGLEDSPVFAGAQMDRSAWPARKALLAETFKARPRAEWCALLEGSDACFAPVLDWAEAPEHPHNQARGTFARVDGITQPGPAPRFSRTPGAIQGPPPQAADALETVLARWVNSD